MKSLKNMILDWLGLYDLLLKIDNLEKEIKLYKSKLEYFASAASGMADIVQQNMCVGDAKKMEDARIMMTYLAGCFKKREW